MADRYAVGGSFTWDNSTTTNWSTSSGGSGGASVPGSSDAVIFDANSGGGTITLNYAPSVVSITGGAHTGTFDTANNNITVQTFSYTGTGSRTLTLGSSTITVTGNAATIVTFATVTNLTISDNTATFDCNYSGSTGTRTVIMAAATTATNSININFSAGSDALSLNVLNYKNLNFTGYSGACTFSTSNPSVYGNLTFGIGQTNSGARTMTLKPVSGQTVTIQPNGASYSGPFTIFGHENSTTKLLGNYQTSSALRLFSIAAGNFTCVDGATNSSLTVGTLSIGVGAASTVELGTATHTILGSPSAFSATLTGTLNASNCTLKFTAAAALTFAAGTSRTYGDIWFDCGTSTGTITITATTAFTLKNFKDTGTAAHSITFPNITTNITSLSINGGAGKLVTLQRTGASGQWTISDTSGTNAVTYCNISNSVATGGATWIASVNTNTDGGGNSGWDFSAISTNTGNFFQFIN